MTWLNRVAAIERVAFHQRGRGEQARLIGVAAGWIVLDELIGELEAGVEIRLALGGSSAKRLQHRLVASGGSHVSLLEPTAPVVPAVIARQYDRYGDQDPWPLLAQPLHHALPLFLFTQILVHAPSPSNV